jgi:hypothetical protein
MAAVLVLAGAAQGTTITLPHNMSVGGVDWFGLSSATNGMLRWQDASSGPSGGGGDHWDDAMGVRVGGSGYLGSGTFDKTGNTITGPVQSLDGLDVTVQYRAVGGLPVMRQLVCLTNPSTTIRTTTVSWHSNTGNDSGQRIIGTSTGDLSAGLDDRWIVTADNSNLAQSNTETNAWVLYGGASPAVPTSGVSMVDGISSGFGWVGEQGLSARFDMALNPGQTRYLMWFAAVTPTGQAGLNQAAAITPGSSTWSTLTDDLTSEQLNATANWTASSQNAVVPEPLTLIGVLGGITGLGGYIRKRRAA